MGRLERKMMEIWKNIDGFENYQVSIWGNIRNKNRILTPYVTQKGYLKIGLSKNGKNYKKRVHRLVAEAFIPNPHNLPQVNHKDGNPKNNSITNLEWCTNQENKSHAMKLRSGNYVIYENETTIADRKE